MVLVNYCCVGKIINHDQSCRILRLIFNTESVNDRDELNTVLSFHRIST